MIKHTPSPWTAVSILEQTHITASALHPSPNIVATLQLGECDKANAALIAAAPEMYNLLRVCEVELMPDDDCSGNMELWRKIRTILAKAEGKK